MKIELTARRQAFWELVIAAAAVLPYLQTLGHGFALDDRVEVVDNLYIRSWANVRTIFTTPIMEGSGIRTQLYRPLTTFSFALDHAIAGLTPWWFHLVNLLLHVVVSLLVFRVVRGWFEDCRIAFGAAILFAVLPVHVEAVANVAGRKELLAAAFCLTTILLHRCAQSVGGWWLMLPPLTFAAALLSKEIGAAALGVLAAEDLLLRRDRAFGAARNRTLYLYGALTLFLAGYLIARWHVVGGFAPQAIAVLDNPAAHTATSTRWLTAIAVAGLGMRLQVAPFGLSPDYSLAAIPLATSALDPRVVATLSTLAGVGVVLWLLRRNSGLWVGAVLYGLALLPASNLIFAVGTIFGERLLYLPSVSTCALLAFVWGRASRVRAPLAAAALALVAVLASVGTALYAATWRDDATLFSAAFRTRPQSAKVRYNYAIALRDRGDLHGALEQYSAAIAIHGGYQQAWHNRGSLRVLLGDDVGALVDFSSAIELDPRDAYAFNSRGLLLRTRGTPDRAIADFDAAIALDPDYGEALLNRALAHQALGDRAAARSDARAALERTSPNWRHRALAEQVLAQVAP